MFGHLLLPNIYKGTNSFWKTIWCHKEFEGLSRCISKQTFISLRHHCGRAAHSLEARGQQEELQSTGLESAATCLVACDHGQVT